MLNRIKDGQTVFNLANSVKDIKIVILKLDLELWKNMFSMSSKTSIHDK